jgi:hypothetical protein
VKNGKPFAVDLFCGLGGWTESLLSEGWFVVGFDIERHIYGDHQYPKEAHLVLQDVTTLSGSQFKDAELLVASPPCQAYSYRAMPWKRAKALPPPSNELFDACFRIQREACEAAGHHIPMIVENVRGAQPWVGRSKWHYGSYHLWGDVPALMPITFRGFKSTGMNWSDRTKKGQDFTRVAGRQRQTTGEMWRELAESSGELYGVKQGGDWFGKNCESRMSRRLGSKSKARKAASAQIAKIPFPLAVHIARVFKPEQPASLPETASKPPAPSRPAQKESAVAGTTG